MKSYTQTQLYKMLDIFWSNSLMKKKKLQCREKCVQGHISYISKLVTTWEEFNLEGMWELMVWSWHVPKHFGIKYSRRDYSFLRGWNIEYAHAYWLLNMSTLFPMMGEGETREPALEGLWMPDGRVHLYPAGDEDLKKRLQGRSEGIRFAS